MKTSKMLLAVAVSLSLYVAPNASAEDGPLGPFHIQVGAAVGGPTGMSGFGYGKATTQDHSWRLAVRTSLPEYTPLFLEFSAVGYNSHGYKVPQLNGFGVNVLFNVIHAKWFRLHALDLGIFRNVCKPVSVQRLSRDWDLTLGAGADISLGRGWSLTVDWRAFLPDPTKIPTAYAEFSIPMYKEALKGGQLWLGFAHGW